MSLDYSDGFMGLAHFTDEVKRSLLMDLMRKAVMKGMNYIHLVGVSLTKKDINMIQSTGKFKVTNVFLETYPPRAYQELSWK